MSVFEAVVFVGAALAWVMMTLDWPVDVERVFSDWLDIILGDVK